MKILQAIMAMKIWKFAEKCPAGKRGRPMSKSPEAAEAEGIEVCEKETRDGRTVAYKTGKQIEKDKQAKGERKAEREKVGAKGRGRLSKINRDKILAIRNELMALRGVNKAKLESKIEEGNVKTKPEVKPEVKTKQVKQDKNNPLPMDDPNVARVERSSEESSRVRSKMGMFKRVPLEKLGVTPEQDAQNISTLAEAYFTLKGNRPLMSAASLPDIFFEAKKKLPNLTIEQFKQTMTNLKEEGKVDFYHINSPGGDEEPEFAMATSLGTIYYAGFNSDEFTKESESYRKVEEARKKQPGESWEAYDKRMDEMKSKTVKPEK